MKYIEKKIQNEPQHLRIYRDETPGASYSGYNQKEQSTGEYPLKLALLREQGFLCAYCMGKISVDGEFKMTIEHYLPQEEYPKLQLVYKNLLGVCNGRSEIYPDNTEVHHCDKTPGPNGKMNGQVKLKKLNPLKRECETLLTYTGDGHIVSINNDADVNFDITEVLNLNNDALVTARKAVITILIKELTKEKQKGMWTEQMLRKYLDKYSFIRTDGSFIPYCMIAIWYLNQRMKSKTIQP
jgi:uncharacterized protein (TIGR02646 family)